MSKIHYVGFNGYQQCPTNDTENYKTVDDWASISSKDKILNISCSHRILVAEMSEVFNLSGIVDEKQTKPLLTLKKPAKTGPFICSDKYLVTSEGNNIWFYQFKTRLWMQPIIHFENELSCKCKWLGSENEIIKFSHREDNESLLVLLKNGTVWSLSDEYCLRLIYENNQDEAVDISSGFEHTLILTASGVVFAYGNGSRGQLGNDSLTTAPEPVKISTLNDMKISTIAAGGWHSCAVTSLGDLYTWGWNNYGQISQFKSHEKISLVTTPKCVEVDTAPILAIVDVACGSRHTVIKQQNGSFYSAGWNGYGQLGLSTVLRRVQKFSKVDFKTDTSARLYCGPWYTVLLHDQKK